MKFFSTHITLKSVLGMVEMLELETTKKIIEYNIQKNGKGLWELSIKEEEK